jgi:hypothetical protein
MEFDRLRLGGKSGLVPARIKNCHVSWAFLVCLSTCLIATYWVRSYFIWDRGSLFSDPSHGYQARYSAVRQRQADAYITQQSFEIIQFDEGPEDVSKQLCVGILSVARGDTSYLPATVGSLLADLSTYERDQIHLVILVAHSDPSQHPTFHEPWMAHLVNEVLVYNRSQVDMDRILLMEQDPNHREKGLYDWATTGSNICSVVKQRR